MPQTQPTENQWLYDILDDFRDWVRHNDADWGEMSGSLSPDNAIAAILDGLQARGWKSPEEVKQLRSKETRTEILALVNDVTSDDSFENQVSVTDKIMEVYFGHETTE